MPSTTSSSSKKAFPQQQEHSAPQEEQFQRRPLQDNVLVEGHESDNLFMTMNSNVTTTTTMAPTVSPSSLQPHPDDTVNMILTILLPFLLLLTVAMCSRRNNPGREYWNGARIAANARRVREQRRIKATRKALTPEERSLQIHTSMRSMTVVGVDKQGLLRLSEDGKPLVAEKPKSNSIFKKPDPEGAPVPPLGDEEQSLEEDFQLIQRKGSHDSQDTEATAPEDDVPSPPTSGNSIPDNQDEENVCYICLDSFEVGDKVMWSRLHKRCDEACSEHGCRHVFHQECIMPWLLEKRENECPSCRAPFIVDGPAPKKQQPQLTPEEEADIILAAFAREIEMGNEDAAVNAAESLPASSSNNQPVDIEAMVESIDADDDTTTLDVDEGYSFVIDQGLIKTVPNFHGNLAVPIPFRRQQISQPNTITTNRTADTAEESNDDESENSSDEEENITEEQR